MSYSYASAYDVNSSLRPQDEIGVAAVSTSLYANVTKYHAQIGANVDRDVLQQLEWNLLAEAKTLFHQRKFEEALNTFTHCLAVTEKTRSAKDHAVRGAVIHNIASCLHNLGEMESAQAYYEQAVEAFQKAKTPMLEKAIYGDPNKRRIEFVKERLVDISWGRKPDGDKYLDENGVKRPVAPVYGAPPPDANEQTLSDRWRAPPEEQDDYDEPGLPAWARQGPAEHAPPARGPSSPIREEWRQQGGSASQARANEPWAEPHNQWRRQADARPSHAPSHHPGAEQRRSGEPAAGTPDGDDDEGRDDREQEAARKEWLQYHMQLGEWDKAEELVVTAEEREDLDYLRGKELRDRELAPPRRASPRSAPTLPRPPSRLNPTAILPPSYRHPTAILPPSYRLCMASMPCSVCRRAAQGVRLWPQRRRGPRRWA